MQPRGDAPVHGKMAQPVKMQCMDESCSIKHFHFDCI